MSTNMTDEDRAPLGALTRLNDACDKLGRGITEGNLSQEDHIELALLFLDMADRMLKRMIDSPEAAEDDSP